MLKSEIARAALTKAMEIRTKANIPLTNSLSIYDFVETKGIKEVQFVEIPSLEELYWKDEKMILISSLRPTGRQAFNCGHGFGHHIFGHGMCITSLANGSSFSKKFDPKEFLVDCFADFLLMPKTTVCHGFNSRGWDIKTVTPFQIYTVAGWLGVGYSTLIQHMRDTLKLISSFQSDKLLRTKPLQLRAEILGEKSLTNVVVVDEAWNGRPVDISVGDYLLLTSDMSFDGSCLEFYKKNLFGFIIRGLAPGCDGKIWSEKSEWSIQVRVSRPNYKGRNIFRFEEDPDYDQNEILSN